MIKGHQIALRILIINGESRYPLSRGEVEAFNKTIIQKINEDQKDFEINLSLDKSVNKYNNTVFILLLRLNHNKHLI